MVGRGRGGRGATGRGTPIEDVGDQGVASQTQQDVDHGVTSRGSDNDARNGRGLDMRKSVSRERLLVPASGKIRKIFDIVRITENDMKVSFASYQLVGEANEWWESIKESKGVDREEKQRDSTQGSVGQPTFGASIPASSSNPSNPSRISKSQFVCHRCNQPGHIRSECPQRVCYNCGQQGHISTNCPQGKNTHSGVGSVQCNSRVQDILLIISKGTNNRGTNLSSRVSQSLPSKDLDLEWREGMLLLQPSSFQDREGDMCRVRECKEGFMQLLMQQQQFHLRLSLL
ncbi:hypothetical protein Acr_26g0001500 [Actinidia rufa]|uniref:CCHC-type domain-containing protein n=1 Tax=Actinidia rufa TaxID=165716 RepID=A0A7J0H190_9ERIC|nr:hypothetical protein Acr_26g0001500 [Actinidia rufa]